MTLRRMLVGLLTFLGLGAVAGGGPLVLAPNGSLFGIPPSILHDSFPNFFMPGLLLVCFIGIFPLATAYALLAKPKWRFAERVNFYTDMHWSWTACISVAFTLIFWIQAEMLILRGVHWLHGFYTLLAVVILFIALLPKVRAQYTLSALRA
jgi:hypothetical protein